MKWDLNVPYFVTEDNFITLFNCNHERTVYLFYINFRDQYRIENKNRGCTIYYIDSKQNLFNTWQETLSKNLIELLTT